MKYYHSMTTRYRRYVAGVILIMMNALLFSCAKENLMADDDGKLFIDSIAPTQGSAGTRVHLYGRGFSAVASENKVTLNGVVMPVEEPASFGALIVEVPDSVAGGPVHVEVATAKADGPLFNVYIPVIEDAEPPYRGNYGLYINGHYFINDVKRLRAYYNDVEKTVTSAVLETDGSTTAYVSGYPAANEENPTEIVIESDGLKSLPHEYIVTPLISYFDVDYDVSPGKVRVTLSGSYFGNAGEGKEMKMVIVNTSTEVTTQIISWTPTSIVIDMDNIRNAYTATVVINGVFSSGYTFKF